MYISKRTRFPKQINLFKKGWKNETRTIKTKHTALERKCAHNIESRRCMDVRTENQ
jgi:hypothetical protein